MELSGAVRPAVEEPRREHARYSYFPGLPGTELLTARFAKISFARHLSAGPAHLVKGRKNVQDRSARASQSDRT